MTWSNQTLFLVVKDLHEEDVDNVLMFANNQTKAMAFTTREAAESHREDLLKQELKEQMQTEESCGVIRNNGNIILWDGYECYKIIEITVA